MSTASSSLAMNSYFTKWRGGYKTWKGDSKQSNEPNTCAAPLGRAAGMAFNLVLSNEEPTGWYPKHRPIKHWRRSYSSNSGKIPIRTIDTPGGTIFKSKACNNTDVNNPGHTCGVPIVSDYKSKINLNTTCCRGEGLEILNDNNSPTGQWPSSSTPAKRAAQKVRNGSTFGSKKCNENKRYYSSTSAYLKSRCNNFDSKTNTARPEYTYNVANKQYTDSHGHIVTDESIIDLNSYITNCGFDGTPNKCTVKTIYKPCNKTFSTNTAVSSSSRIARLKHDTVIKSAHMQGQIWGPETESASTYSGRPEMPYTTKAKYHKCVDTTYK
jgi:hypothetical protein